jgi:predicted ABC-class ATPase
MQALVAKGKEPITPFIDKVRQLYQAFRVSTVLVIGGSGDYFDVADMVIMMDEYQAFDVTAEAKRISRELGSLRRPEGGEAFGALEPRVILTESFQAQRGKREKVNAKGLNRIVYGTTEVDLSFVEQLVDPSQTRAIAEIMHELDKKWVNNRLTINEVLDGVLQAISEKGLDVISPYAGQHPGDLALPRKMEIAAAINRLRTLKIKHKA